MSGYMKGYCALSCICLAALAGVLVGSPQRADAIAIVESQTEQDAQVNATLSHPCNNAEMVNVSGNTHIVSKTSVTTSTAKVDITASWGAMAAQNLTNGATYTASGSSSATVNLGPLPSSGKATVATSLTGSNGETMTAYLDLDVSVASNGATVVYVHEVRLKCGSLEN
ncbi:MAG: hypothetical protein AAB229_06430 [Candidatus Hydrogenedentota bacterium]